MSTTIEVRAFKGSFYGVLLFGLTFVQSILLVPLLLQYWGDTQYGLYISIFALLLVLRTLDFGFQSFIGNDFNKLYHIDKKRAGGILGSGLRIALLLGLLEFVVLAALVWQGAFNNIIGLDNNASKGLILGVLGMAVMWGLSGTSSGILAKAVLSKGLYPATALWGILYKSLEILLLLYACFGLLPLSTFLLIWSAVSFVYFGFTIRWAIGQLKDVGVSIFKGSWAEGIRMLVRSLVLTVNSFLEQLSINGTLLLVTNFLTIVLVPVFSTIRTLTNTVVQLTGLVVNPLQPEMIRYHSEGSGLKIRSVFTANWLICGCLVNIPLLLLLPFVEWLYQFWTKGLLEFNYSLFLLLAGGVSMSTFGRGLTAYLQGINDLRSIAIISVVKFTILFAISILFIQNMGLVAIGLGTVLSELVGSVVLPLVFAKKKLSGFNIDLAHDILLLAIAPIGVVICALSMAYFEFSQTWIPSIFGTICLFSLYAIQWNKLDEEVRNRLMSIGSRLIRRNF